MNVLSIPFFFLQKNVKIVRNVINIVSNEKIEIKPKELLTIKKLVSSNLCQTGHEMIVEKSN